MTCRISPARLAALGAAPPPGVTRRGARVRVADLDLLTQITLAGLPAPETEVRVCPGRRWRWDLCWRRHMVAVELQGGTWVAGKHVRGAGYENDCRKLAEGVLLGWRVFWVTPGMARDGSAVRLIGRALGVQP